MNFSGLPETVFERMTVNLGTAMIDIDEQLELIPAFGLPPVVPIPLVAQTDAPALGMKIGGADVRSH
jgi:hypothetical protein